MSEVKKKAVAKKDRNFEVELMEEKIKALESKIAKPQSKEELFQERLAKYEASKPRREALAAKINQRRRELQEMYPKARYEEVKILEAWERRAEQLKDSDPNASARFKYEFKVRISQINKDPMR